MMNVFDWMEQVFTDSVIRKQALSHENWRVRYSAAVAIGESRDPEALADLEILLAQEDHRQLYSQPKVQSFTNSYDDTRMAEQIVEIEAVFDQEYDEGIMEDWKCRGRVRQAVLCAVEQLGRIDQHILSRVYRILEDDQEDYTVKMQACRVLRVCGDQDSLPYLEIALKVDEWCTQMEAGKAIKAIEEKERRGEKE